MLSILLTGSGPATLPLPPMVFVSRQAPSGHDAGQIPGLGPHGSAIAVGGRLLVRERETGDGWLTSSWTPQVWKAAL